jgi:hypothetical protein
MEISTPTWNRGDTSYSFRILKSDYVVVQDQYYESPSQSLELPANLSSTDAFVREFLDKTKKYFTNPLTPEKIFRHLRLTLVDSQELPSSPGWYKVSWKPHTFTIKSGDYNLSWYLASTEQTPAIIPAEFTSSTTPRAQSPQAPEQTAAQLRNIQIHDSLIPVGDLPLSDLPPLFFSNDETDPAREDVKRRIREARLKVQLAKLKAQRMEHKYFERYGQSIEDSEGSSEFSSESEEGDEVPF